MLYGVVRFHNMWYNGAVFQPEVLCVKLNYDRKSKDVMNFQDTFYAATYDCGEVCTALNAAFGLGLDRKYYEPKALNKKLKKILK